MPGGIFDGALFNGLEDFGQEYQHSIAPALYDDGTAVFGGPSFGHATSDTAKFGMDSIRYIGPSDELDPDLLALRPVDDKQEIHFPNGTHCRRVSRHTHFALVPYSRTRVRAQELQELDAIEKIVSPHGKSLVNLYFRMVHPCFPILDKKTFMEKYARTHREFSSPCLAGVYMLAAKWWHHDRELSAQKKPDIDGLERIARTSLQSVIDRPKLSTLQGGLLLLQHGWSHEGAWALSAQMVAVAQDLGIDSSCAGWTIPTWESGLRRRLGWAIYMMDKWMALCRGRPSHIIDDDWTPDVLSAEDFVDIEDGEEADDTIEGSVDVVAGGKAFESMIFLTHIVSQILQKFYSRKALADKSSNIRTVLEQIKPIQVRLREWHRDLPASLQLDASASQRLSPNASLHLAYFAAEFTLHRVLLRSLLRHPCDPYIVQICRAAPKERVTSAVDLVARLGGQHLQAFWYSPSGYCLVTIGTFTALMFITSQSTKEAETYKKTLSNYRWLLRVNSRATEYMDFAVQRLDLSLSHIHELTAEDIVGQSTPVETGTPKASGDAPSPGCQVATATDMQAGQTSAMSEARPKAQPIQWTQENALLEGVDDTLPPSFFYEDAVLNAMENQSPLHSSHLRQYQLPPLLYPMSPAFDFAGATTRTLEYESQPSEQGDSN
ncbi:Fungal specific transcription factor [Emericellopsis cladophorae]|uniref:Fungal specific transcription factor n=1 Tax=Emericellopsis cladophorae TaxID=2686198 RepID=A0A9P9Y649_9HYPO|nr:Fungal specific transcription factor [Emericellopsis cladophorae]KAI6784126.1 Fungal specific transcription factor [Emericellopsis cladophorae]